MSDGFEADIEILNQIIQEAQEVRNATSKAKLVREIVPIERWLFDEYYIGKSGMHLYDYWRKVMVEIFGVRKGLINEVIVTGGLGCRPIKGTTYDTNHGKLSMSDIKELIKTQIVTINSPLGDTTIIDVHNVGNKPCNSILFNNGYNMVATTDHSFWVIENSNYIWKELKDIQVGDKLPYYDESTNKWTSVTVCSNEPYGTIECGDIEVDGHMYINKGLVQHNTGKSTFGLYCLLRKIYELSCYENVANLFKLMPNSILMLIYFSVSKDQAELTGYGQLRNIIDEIEYFRENFPRDDKIDSLLRFPENVLVRAGSDTSHSIGANLIGALLDEANFFQKGAQDPSKLVAAVGRISTLYTSIVNRASSRFKNKERDDSLCILISSNTTSSSFTDERIRKTIGQPNVLVINARLWEVKPKGTYSEDMFYVYAGSDFVDPFVINQIEDLLQLPDVSEVMLEDRNIEDVVKLLPVKEQELFVKVPQDFHKEFNNDVVQSLQDIAGMSVAPSGRLFSSKKVYKESCTDFYRHPFTSEQFIIQTQSPVKVADFVDPRYRPVYRERGRCIHIDQSTTNDSTGFASSFIEGYTNIDGITKPVVAVDLMVRINPPKPPYKISIPKTRDFIFYMRDKWGLPITCVSYDQFASAESRQVLSENGVTNEYLSVDRSDEQYLTFIEMLYEGRIKWYHYKPAEDELFNLIHFRDKKKVDHPIGGCFTGDTLVLLSDGSYQTIDTLSKQKNQLVYGYRQDINKFISTNMTQGSLTKRTNTIIDVYIKDNNIISKVSCTEDHKFLLDTGLYMPARVLEVGDRLKSIYKAFVYKVEVRHIPEGINVYDITVPETSNFIIHPGIVVHNSKDVMDAVVGSVWSTLQHNESVNSMNTAGDLDNIIDNMLLDDEDDEDDSWILEDYR